MVHYKLTYFSVRALAEVSRQLFALAGVEFEDERIELGNVEAWQKVKPSTPFGQMPVLSVDGLEIPQSLAIARYLARKFGYAGKTAEEEAWVDAVADQYKDFYLALRTFIHAGRNKKSAEEIDAVRKEVTNPARDAYFKIVNQLLEKSKSGFLVGDSVTYADLIVADNLTTLENLGFYNPSEQPKLAEFQKRVQSIPALKEWIEKRPVTEL